MRQNKEAQFAGHLEPPDGMQWTDYPYLYSPINDVRVKHFNLDSDFTLHYANESKFLDRDIFQLIICFSNSKILIKAHCPDEYWFYDFDKLDKEFHDKVDNLVKTNIFEHDQKKSLLVEHGWMDLKELNLYNVHHENGMFKLIKHPEFGLYQPHMKIKVFEHSFYIELPDNPICKQKFNEWLEEHVDKYFIEQAIKNLEVSEDDKS